MAREVESVHQFTHSAPYSFEKEKTVVRCDDGTVYEFEVSESSPEPRLVRSVRPDGTFAHTNTNGRLPAAVKETASDMFGRWSK